MFAFSSYFYFQALKITDASIVVALFQIVPVFSLILTFIFFHEILTIKQLIGILIIIIAAMVMSLKKNQGIFNFIPFIYMLITTITSAIYFFTLEIAIKLSNYSNALVLFQLSLFIIGIILMFIKSYRLSFFHMLDYQKKLVGFNFLNETLTLIANILNNFANTLIPLAIVNALSSFQIVFTFLIGIVGSLIIPKLFYEQIDKKTIIKKITCIGLELFGVYLMTI